MYLLQYSHLQLGLASGPFPLSYPFKNAYIFFAFQMYATRAAHLILLDETTQIIFGDD
jgi:hypothetical protein